MPEILITQNDQGRTIKANQGDLIEVRLAENLSTGYGWELEEFDSPVLELLDSEHAQDRGKLVQDRGKLVGRGGTRTIRYRVKSSGSQHIQLAYRRPKEVAAEHFDVNIEVQ